MRVAPYLSFDGNCAEAMEFYKGCLGGGTLTVRKHAESPTPESVPPEMLDKVLHAHLAVDELTLMGADVPSAHYTTPSPMVQLLVSVATDERAEGIFAALSAGGTILMPIQQTYWTTRFGMLKDKFRVSWMVSSENVPA